MARVMIVDDNAEQRRLLEEAFHERGVKGTVLYDQADNALSNYFGEEIVITDFDFGIGYMNGLSFARYLRKRGATCFIIMMTGADPGYVPWMDSGIDECWSKRTMTPSVIVHRLIRQGLVTIDDTTE